MALGETPGLQAGNEASSEADESLQRGQLWVDSLREVSELEGVLVGDPEDELQSAYYTLGEEDVMTLIPGYAFWRIREDVSDETSISAPYQTAKPMEVTSYRLRRDNRGETWVHLRSPVGDGPSFEKAHVRLSRLESGEHKIAINPRSN